MTDDRKALLVYDGDCDFCRYSITYARARTGDRVTYRPYQSLSEGFGGLTTDEFRGAVQWFEDGERRAQAAEASFRVLAQGGAVWWLRLYRYLPGFAALSEWLYHWVARHRSFCYRAARRLIGPYWLPLQSHRVGELFTKALALIFLCAFVSFAVQARGLIGSDGILPVADFLQAARQQLGDDAYRLLPTLLWFSASDAAILAVCAGGVLASVLMWRQNLPRLSALLATLFYLSLVTAGQVFTLYQWDLLLLECGLVALIFAQWPRLGVWLFRWLLFRFMFLSGAVKLLSGDPHWRDLTALGYHFETQPLPTMVAWYAHYLPAQVLQAMTAAMLFIELVLAFFMLGPRRLRAVAAVATLLLQLVIFITGNYNFFNLLTVALCLMLLDDAMLPRWLQARIPLWIQPGERVGIINGLAATAVLAAVLTVSGAGIWSTFSGRQPAGELRPLLAAVEPFHLVNRYGLFAIMTTERREVVIEGSDDGEHWRVYPARFKPDRVDRAPRWVAPHQPRLDWQLWFAALSDYQRQFWMQPLLLGLMTGSAPIAELFADNPFASRPPSYIRAVVYRYRFASPEVHAQTGLWWQREYLGPYSPVLHLKIEQPPEPW